MFVLAYSIVLCLFREQKIHAEFEQKHVFVRQTQKTSFIQCPQTSDISECNAVWMVTWSLTMTIVVVTMQTASHPATSDVTEVTEHVSMCLWDIQWT